MRIAISSPIRWATGLAAVVTVAVLSATLATRPAPPRYGDSGKLARAELARIERELDALSDRLQESVAALDDAESEADRGVVREAIVKLMADITVVKQVELERARELRATLTR